MLFRGATLEKSRCVAVTSDQKVIDRFAMILLNDLPDAETDPVLSELNAGKRRLLLRLVGGGDR